jgi:beta-glucanase (GH16 family)
MSRIFLMSVCGLFMAAATVAPPAFAGEDPSWEVDFFDDFDTFDPENWQDQILWVNKEAQCYVRDGAHNTREVSAGTLKLRVVNLGEEIECDNRDKFGEQHPPTRYVAGRIASKNLKEFAKGKWTARLRLHTDGQNGMFPAWWLLGARNNEPPVQEEDENVCWPLVGSGEIDIWEHYGGNGSGHFAARMIKNLGHCDGGDWESAMKVIDVDNTEWHEYSVEWDGDDLVFRVDDEAVYRIEGGGAEIQEPLFAILNYGMIGGTSMEGEWVMEVDWVKHEYRH